MIHNCKHTQLDLALKQSVKHTHTHTHSLSPSFQLALKTVNLARSAFASFLFHRKFFHSYNDGLRPDQEGGGGEGEEGEEETIKCKITIKVSNECQSCPVYELVFVCVYTNWLCCV